MRSLVTCTHHMTLNCIGSRVTKISSDHHTGGMISAGELQKSFHACMSALQQPYNRTADFLHSPAAANRSPSSEDERQPPRDLSAAAVSRCHRPACDRVLASRPCCCTAKSRCSAGFRFAAGLRFAAGVRYRFSHELHAEPRQFCDSICCRHAPEHVLRLRALMRSL